jgi:arabinofuranan 3-O-arabinosyltransferase
LFLYPPSSLLLLRPVAFVSLHAAQVGGLVLTAAMIWVTVMLSAQVLGRRWWGLAAALVVLALHWAEPATEELVLENVTVLCCVALAIFFLRGSREHWMSAGLVIGLSLCVKPLFLPILLVFVLARKWAGLAVAVVVPAVLNLVAFAVVKDPTQVFTKLPSLLSRSGSGALLNSAWVDVFRTFALPHWATILVRLVTVVLALIGAWLAWRLLHDARLRLVTTASVLLIGAYLGGTLSENHYMLTLVPLAMTVVLPLSPMRQVTAWIGMLLLMGLTPPASMLGIDIDANLSAYRAFGMSLVLLTIVVVLGRRWYHDRAIQPVTMSAGSDARLPAPGPGDRRRDTPEAALTQ